MTTTTTAKPTHDHFVWETLDDLSTLTSFVDEGLGILDGILSDMGQDEPAGAAYMINRIKEHTKALEEGLSAAQRAFRGRVWVKPQSGKGSDAADPDPTPSTSTTASDAPGSDDQVIAEAMGRAIDHPTVTITKAQFEQLHEISHDFPALAGLIEREREDEFAMPFLATQLTSISIKLGRLVDDMGRGAAWGGKPSHA